MILRVIFKNMKKLLMKCKGENDVRRFELERFVDAIHRYNGLPDSWSVFMDASFHFSYCNCLKINSFCLFYW